MFKSKKTDNSILLIENDLPDDYKWSYIQVRRFYEKHKDDILLFPTKQEREKLGSFVTKKVKFNKDNKIDIAISGLGFVTVYGTGYLEVTYFNNVKVIVRKAMI